MDSASVTLVLQQPIQPRGCMCNTLVTEGILSQLTLELSPAHSLAAGDASTVEKTQHKERLIADLTYRWGCNASGPAQVHLLVRGSKMRASAAMQDRVLNHERVEVHFSTEVADAYGDKKGLKGLQLRDTSTGQSCPMSHMHAVSENSQCTHQRSLIRLCTCFPCTWVD